MKIHVMYTFKVENEVTADEDAVEVAAAAPFAYVDSSRALALDLGCPDTVDCSVVETRGMMC